MSHGQMGFGQMDPGQMCQDKWSPGQMGTRRMGLRINAHRDKWVPNKRAPDKWTPGQMSTRRMCLSTNGWRTIGPIKLATSKFWTKDNYGTFCNLRRHFLI